MTPVVDWRKILARTGGFLESRVDRVLLAGRMDRARQRAVQIVPYRGFGTSTHLSLHGRVLIQKQGIRVSDHESVWQNLLATYRRLHSEEIPGARLQARFRGDATQVTSDEEGYFHVRFEPNHSPSTDVMWHDVELELLEPLPPGKPALAIGQVLVPPADAEFGVISDLDDTVIQTGATSLLRMLRATFLQSARSRLPFDGVAEFYGALHGGRRGIGHNPIFYVSSSPWNLYDLLTEFLDIQGIVPGPLLLGDFGFDQQKWIHLAHQEHKHQQIQRIFDIYPHLSFVFVGDSGQRDPEIYLDLVKSDPRRVLGVYIRDVTTPRRDAEVHAIAARAAEAGVEMVLVNHTSEAVEHARRRGLIVGGE